MLDVLTGFVGELRAAGIPVSLSEHLDAAETLRHIPLEDRQALKHTLGAVLVKSSTHWPAYETAFEIYFALRGPDHRIDDTDDTSGARERLAMFLAQYWGGPHEYMEKRGHPMLRARHNQWAIGEQERDRWLVHMLGALESTVAGLSLGQDVRDRILGDVATYMVNAAEHMRNT